jgi:ABC-type dipeptide/oligopeptide/nickel transport system permease component
VQGLLNNLPIFIILVALIAFLVYTGIRVGPNFLIRRLAGLVFVVIGVTFITFELGTFNIRSVVLIQCTTHCTPTIVAQLLHFYHLDEPWYLRYLDFLNGLVHFNLGYSVDDRTRSVLDILGNGIPISLTLQVEAITLQVIVGVPLGIVTALRAGSRLDTTSNSVALLFYALPTYVTILFYRILTVFLAQHNLPHLPIFGWNGPFAVEAIAPVTLLAAAGTAFFVRLTRTSMLDVLRQDYVRTARAKGLRERAVIYRHAFRNALIPLVTALATIVGLSVTGAFFTENFFQINGIAYWAVQSIAGHDVPVIQGTVLIAALAIVLMNLVADVAYGILDPRIKVA